MPEESKKTNTRRVESHDPSLSPEANQLLTDELQAVIGTDTVQVPASRPDPAGDRHATHTPFVANVIGVRLALILTALVLLITAGLIIANRAGSAIILIIVFVFVFVFVALAAAVGVIVSMTNRMTAQREHVSPEVAAALEEEGIGEPDRVLTDLVTEYTEPATTDPGERPAA